LAEIITIYRLLLAGSTKTWNGTEWNGMEQMEQTEQFHSFLAFSTTCF